jgi:lipoprotein-anchoring transpeptidase ErfK/SrfK
MTSILRLAALLSFTVLAACATTPTEDEAPQVSPPGYGAMEDEGFSIPAVEPRHLTGGREKAQVPYNGSERPGTVVVDTFARKLYLVEEGGTAMRYSVAVGREGLSFRGAGTIQRKEKWPSWQPTANMVRTRPDLYAEFASGMKGGLDNPLGARAMYLYRGGRDTMFRIHGTVQNATVGHATSAGCIRLYNQDAIDLFDRVDYGTVVKVRSKEESLELEGPYMDDAWGLAVPETPEAIAEFDLDVVKKAEQEAAEAAALAEAEAAAAAEAAAYAAMTPEEKARFDAKKVKEQEKADALAAKEKAAAEAKAAKEAEKAAKEAEKLEKKRLADCKRQGIAAEDCPALPDLSLASAG